MGTTVTNKTSLAYSVEATPGNLAGSPVWKSAEYNSVPGWGAQIEKVARNPISPMRQRQKGGVVDVSSAFQVETDLTMESVNDFMDGFFFAKWRGQALFAPTAVITTAYTVPSGGALTAGALVFARGFTNAANNGLKVVGSGSTGTSVVILGGGLVAETPTAAQNATLEVCGVQAAAADVAVNAGGNLTSTTLNFTTLGLIPGQVCFLGDTGAAFQFATAADRGWFRIKTIAANLLTIDKRSAVFAADTGTGKTIRIFFGRFLSNLSVNDANYQEKTLQFEMAFNNLGVTPGVAEYQYAKGSYCNEVKISAPLTSKATVSYGFVGFDTPPPSTTRATNAATPVQPVERAMFNTVSDVGRLRVTNVDETGLSSYIKSATLMLRNGASAEKVIGSLGAVGMNFGNIEADVELEGLFTQSETVTAIRDNRTVTYDMALKNGDGGLFFDIPSATIEGGDLSLPVNETVKIGSKIVAFQDPTLGYSMSLSTFPYIPAS